MGWDSFTYSKGHCRIHYDTLDGNCYIQSVFTDREFRQRGELKKALTHFLKEITFKKIFVSICPDRKADGTYDEEMDGALVRTFRSLGFTSTELDGEIYPKDLELNR